MSGIDCTFFDKISRAKFMKEYWGRRPLFVKGGAKGLTSVVSAKKILELSTDEAFTSRLISTDTKHSDWSLDYGPFPKATLSKLGKSCWTVLVQEIDRKFSQLDEVRRHFQVTPNWMFDDIMVSYARDKGSVGPHFDQYDVFLIQGDGSRTWKLSNRKATDSDLLEGLPIKVLKKFRTDQEFLCEEGDVLYVPPHIPHYGISRGDSTTFSVGFRKPTERAVLSHLFEDLLDAAKETVLETGTGKSDRTAELDPDTLKVVRRKLGAIVNDEKALHCALAKEISSNRNGFATGLEVIAEVADKKNKSRTKMLEIQLRTRAVYFKDGALWRFFLNGMELIVPSEVCADLKKLFDERRATFSRKKAEHILKITKV